LPPSAKVVAHRGIVSDLLKMNIERSTSNIEYKKDGKTIL
jgi:hypothetical protein